MNVIHPIAALLAIALAGGVGVRLGGAAPVQPDEDQAEIEPADDELAEQCRALARERHRALEQIREADERLEDLRRELRTVDSSDAKIETIEKILDELIEQRLQRRDSLRPMQERMSEHMARHLMLGMSRDRSDAVLESMKHCPMAGGAGSPQADAPGDG